MSVPFGRYSLLTRLAIGGMAEIFMAEVPSIAGFSKKVVLKLILPELAKDPQFVEMFVNEAKLVAAMTHPNIAQVHELGEVAGRYFIAMEYVSGIDLASALTQFARSNDKIPIPLALRIVHDMLLGLHFAHELRNPEGEALNLVHRDVSPHNVLLSREGAIKVTDFGIAKARNNGTPTRTGIVKGKLAYMAPEQANGRALDRRADLFAAALVLYELLAGERVYNVDEDLVLLNRAREGRIAPLIEKQPSAPLGLSQLLEHALAVDPERRFATGLQFATALRAFGPLATPEEIGSIVQRLAPSETALDDSSLSGVSLSVVGSASQRRVWPFAVGGFVLSTMVVGIALVSHLHRSEKQPSVLAPASLPATLPAAEVPKTVAVSPAAEPMGYLTINTQPWAYISIDGKRLPHPTPLLRWPLKPGKHQVKLFNPSLDLQMEQTVDIHLGKNTPIFHRF